MLFFKRTYLEGNAIKIMGKAYDQLDWDFIKNVLLTWILMTDGLDGSCKVFVLLPLIF